MWVAVADCCLIKLSPFTVAGSRSSPIWLHCHLNPFPLRRTSWYCAYHSLLGTQYSNCSMYSHSGGPLGTIAIHSWDSHALTQLRPVHVDCCYLVVSTSFRVGLYCWFFRLPRTRIVLTWSLLLFATTTDCQFIRFILVDHCRFFRLPWTPDISSRGLLSAPTPTDCSCCFHVASCLLDWTPTDSYHSRVACCPLDWTPTDFRSFILLQRSRWLFPHTAIVSRGPCCLSQLPRTLCSFVDLFFFFTETSYDPDSCCIDSLYDSWTSVFIHVDYCPFRSDSTDS
jgi:hypothetical protein